jgi:hypothetical protein
MISFLISLLVFCLIVSVILWCARLIIAAVPVPQPMANIIYAIVALLLLAMFLSEVGWLGAPHGWRAFR